MKTEVRQSQIIAAALDILAKSGVRGLTVSAIARKTGMAAANVYRHFNGKADIINAVFNKVERFLRELIASSLKTDELAATVRLEEVFFKHIGFIEQHRGIPRIFFSDDGYSADPSVRLRVQGVMKEYVAGVRAIIAHGVQSKEFKQALDVDAVAITFISLVQSIAFQWVISEYAFSPQVRGRMLWKVFINGIRK